MKRRVFLVCTLVLFFAGTALAVPRLINYQGQLHDSTGDPVDGVGVDMIFQFYGSASSDTVLITVVQEDVQVNAGLYNVLVGSGTITPGLESTLDGVFGNRSDVWMGLSVNGEDQMLPRSRITSAPYAIQCGGVDCFWLDSYLGVADYDQDGALKPIWGGDDCCDTNPNYYPGAPEIPCDGIDQNCDGDPNHNQNADGDAYWLCDGDCDDSNGTIYPGASESYCDGIDQNCNGLDDDDKNSDGDWVTLCQGDCDDDNPSVHPLTPEINCDGLDQDCSGADLCAGSTSNYIMTAHSGASGPEQGKDVVVDENGNAFVTGYFFSTANFGLYWSMSDSKTSAGYEDAYVTKVNADDSYGWTARFGGTSHDFSEGLALDREGNLIVAGYFQGTVDFGQDLAASDSKTSAGDYDCFVTKLGTDRSYKWTRRIGGNYIEKCFGVATDKTGNIYVTGSFLSDGINFAEDFGGSDIKSRSGSDIFVTKILPDGSYGWTRKIGGNGGNTVQDESGRSITTDADANVYLTGRFYSAVNFAEDWGGEDMKSSGGNDDIFITRINADGSYGWTRRMGGGGYDEEGRAIAVDRNGVVYVAGRFRGTVNFAQDWGGSDSKTSSVYYNGYITRIKADGSYGWTRRFYCNYYSSVEDLVTDAAGNVYLAGYWNISSGNSTTVNFAQDFGGTDVKNAFSGGLEAFMTKINSDGTYGWTKAIRSPGYDDAGLGIAVDLDGDLWLTGYFQGSVNFALDWGTSDTRTANFVDAFINHSSQ